MVRFYCFLRVLRVRRLPRVLRVLTVFFPYSVPRQASVAFDDRRDRVVGTKLE